MRKTKYLSILCAVILLITALSVPASAAGSIADQMAANSAAWAIANAAGDRATCAALQAANVALANQASSGGGSCSFNSNTGTWSISTSSGTTITSGGSTSDNRSSANYYTTTSGGSTTHTSVGIYSDASIDSYYNAGGTDRGLDTSYNNSASNVSGSEDYFGVNAKTADSEIAVAKRLLGLTDAQASQLQADLESSQQQFVAAQKAYNAAVASGDTSAAQAAQVQMNKAHEKAQAARAEYGYSGDSTAYGDGGYFTEFDKPAAAHDSFYVVDIKPVFTISASNGTGGTISPSGTVNVTQGESKTFTITPNSGYDIDRVTVDGTDKGAISNYTFSNVSGAHTISATFKANGTIEIGSIKITDAADTDLAGDTIKSGYGFFANVDGHYSGVTDVQMTASYDFGQGVKTVALQESSTGEFAFPVNAESPVGARCVYIPVETSDGTYTVTITLTAVQADGTQITESKATTVTVRGNMYEDDATGDS